MNNFSHVFDVLFEPAPAFLVAALRSDVLYADDWEATTGHPGLLGSGWHVSLVNIYPLLLSQTKSTVVLLNPRFTSGAVQAPQELVGAVLLFDLGESRVVWSVKR